MTLWDYLDGPEMSIMERAEYKSTAMNTSKIGLGIQLMCSKYWKLYVFNMTLFFNSIQNQFMQVFHWLVNMC